MTYHLCPGCSAPIPATVKVCAECAVRKAPCLACGGLPEPGERYCHDCIAVREMTIVMRETT